MSDQNGPLPFRQRGDSVRLVLSWEGRERKALRVEYRHHAPERRARYIVTTTRLWRLPLDKARFVVTSKVGPIAVQPWDQDTPGPTAKSWERTATRFFPQADLWVSW